MPSTGSRKTNTDGSAPSIKGAAGSATGRGKRGAGRSESSSTTTTLPEPLGVASATHAIDGLSVEEQQRTRSSTSGRERTSVRDSMPERFDLERFDFDDTYRGPLCLVTNHSRVKSKQRWIRLVDWPGSLVQAYRSGVLTGEAEWLGRAISAMGILDAGTRT